MDIKDSVTRFSTEAVFCFYLKTSARIGLVLNWWFIFENVHSAWASSPNKKSFMFTANEVVRAHCFSLLKLRSFENMHVLNQKKARISSITSLL